MSLTMLQTERGGVPVEVACEALGVPRASFYRAQQPASAPAVRTPRSVPRKLSEADRAAVIAVLHEERFVDQPPGEIVATLLSEGLYLASERTYYRVLAEFAEVQERRAQRRHPAPVKPSLVARAPNQVWTWDITKLAGPAKGLFFYVYVMIDLFSRFVVGWLAADKENGATATRWLREVVTARGVEATELTVHNDRGSPMTSTPFTQLLATLGITASLSRPHVSNDNPFSEAHFKTLKYQPDYPERFGSLLHARGWLEEFFAWHNENHHHSGLAMFTPGQVYRGQVEAVAQRRQHALDAAFAAHPERFVHGAPQVRRPPKEVSINPLVPASSLTEGEAATKARAGACATDGSVPKTAPGRARASTQAPPPELSVAPGGPPPEVFRRSVARVERGPRRAAQGMEAPGPHAQPRAAEGEHGAHGVGRPSPERAPRYPATAAEQDLHASRSASTPTTPDASRRKAH
jgi:putative transposase